MKLSIVLPYRNRRKPELIHALYNLATCAKTLQNLTEQENQERGLDLRRDIEAIVVLDEWDYSIRQLIRDTVDGDASCLRFMTCSGGKNDRQMSLAHCYGLAAECATGRYLLYTSGRDALYGYALHNVFEVLESFEDPEPMPSAVVFRSMKMDGLAYRPIPEPHLRTVEEIEDHEMAPLCLAMSRHISNVMDWSDHEVDNSPVPAYAMLKQLLDAEHSVYLSKRCLGWSL